MEANGLSRKCRKQQRGFIIARVNIHVMSDEEEVKGQSLIMEGKVGEMAGVAAEDEDATATVI